MCRFKLFGRMVIKRKAYTLSIVIIILLSVPISSSVSGSHEDPDQTEEDLAPLIRTLKRTQGEIESSLKEALNVDYNLKDDFSDNYTHEHLNRSNDIADEIEEEFSKPNSVLKEIKGEIGSDKHLEDHFLPFLYISENLTEYTRRHGYLIENLSYAAELAREDQDPGGFVGNSMDHIDQMEYSLASFEKNIQRLEPEHFDLGTLQNLVEQNLDLLDRYDGYVDDLREETEPTILTIFSPRRAYPGTIIEIHGYFLYEGEKKTNENVSLLIDGEKISWNLTSEGCYRFSYKIDWSHELGDMNISAEVQGRDISSRNLSINITRYPSTISLDTEREAYYDEEINITGVFETEAEIDLSQVELNAPLGITINPAKNGSFYGIYQSREFRWGKTNLTVEFSGNRTISEASENISIEVSIPTEIVFFDWQEELEEDEVGNFFVEGRLLNASSEEGLEDQTLTVFLNGEPIEEVQTDINGDFTFTLPEEYGLETGRHTLNVSFEGPEKYRGIDSDHVHFEVRERTMFWNSPAFLAIILITLAVVSFGAYIVLRKEETERKLKDLDKERIDESTSSDISIPTATSRDEVPTAYRDLLETLQDSGLIRISSGKTHREIEDEMSDHPRLTRLEEDIKRVTELFEKALFTDRSIQSNELENFNSSLSSLTKEASS